MACGLELDPVQALGLELAMAERDDGSWAAAVFSFLMSRQNGKNETAVARELFGLVLAGEFIIHTAHHFKTAVESYDRLLDLVHSNSDVSARLVDHHRSVATGHDMVFRGGGRIVFLARGHKGAGRGFAGVDLLVLDEAQELTDQVVADLRPTISARPNAQVWYFGTAPDETAVVWQRQRYRGRRGLDPRTAYIEVSADPDANLDDREAWRQANCALVYGRMLEETIEAERGDMSDDQFAAERLSISPELNESGVLQGWNSVCDATLDLNFGSAACFGLDCSPERTSGAIVAAYHDGPALEVVEYQGGVAWMVVRAVELAEKYALPVVIDRSGPAGSFIEDLERHGVTVIGLDASEMTRACGRFIDLVNMPDTTFRVRTNRDLNAAVAGAVTRTNGDTTSWGRRPSASDISPLVAATGAVYVAERDAPKPVELFSAWA